MLPQWLNHFKNPNYLNEVLEILERRETDREIIRSLARARVVRPNALQTAQFPQELSRQALVDHYDISAGCHPGNDTQNRYIQLEPYNRTRVVVGNCEEERYMNANWVQELYGGKCWIATQAPVPASMHTFLSLIMQKSVDPPGVVPTNKHRRIRTVVQLTLELEGGRRKAHSYFPSQVGQSWQIPAGYLLPGGVAPKSLVTTLLQQTTIEEAHCLYSVVSVTAEGDHPSQTVTFQHLLYKSWPDHGVPTKENCQALITFLKLVDQKNREAVQNLPELDPDPPIMINCSAGIGRTGSFIALSSVFRKYAFIPPPGSPQPKLLQPSPLGPLPREFTDDEVCQEVDSLREQRPGMVQRDEQIILIYQMLADVFDMRST